ncbi:hypothetical protein LCGC14_2072630 [marine sediment metagenome]|uniref:STAS domain-containing protein n=1 Tax=marine sediment metagenome TaxID=412755 RepID=A0A0F9HEZ1_9ZZZZ
MSLDINCETSSGVFILSAHGEMDFHNFRTLRSAVEQGLADGEKRFLLDLADISYLDSSALGSLLYCQKKIREHHGHMAVISSEALTDILNLTHLDSYFSMVDSINDGRQWLSEDKHSAMNG